MSTAKATAPPIRERVERGIYRRVNQGGQTVYVIGYRDTDGRQRYLTTGPKKSVARKVLAEKIAAKGRGERDQANARLKFGEAASEWLAEHLGDKASSTQANYRNSVSRHLAPRWGNRRLSQIRVKDATALIKELRNEGKAETTIAVVVVVANLIFKYAKRHMDWHGENPIAELLKGERPKVHSSGPKRIFEGAELAQTIAAAQEPYKLLFQFAAITGARQSECLGLVWSDIALSDLESALVSFSLQVDRQGNRVSLKTEESRRVIDLPISLAKRLAEHKAASPDSQEGDFVFATRKGTPINQRNVARELRRAMKNATDEAGKPTFPALHAKDAKGKPVPVPRGELPSFHSFRHTAASQAIRDGESAEEVSWQLGHRDSTITAKVYVHELKSAERSAERRAKYEARFAALSGCGIVAADRTTNDQDEASEGAEVVALH